jgi:hypothetical protein
LIALIIVAVFAVLFVGPAMADDIGPPIGPPPPPTTEDIGPPIGPPPPPSPTNSSLDGDAWYAGFPVAFAVFPEQEVVLIAFYRPFMNERWMMILAPGFAEWIPIGYGWW